MRRAHASWDGLQAHLLAAKGPVVMMIVFSRIHASHCKRPMQADQSPCLEAIRPFLAGPCASSRYLAMRLFKERVCMHALTVVLLVEVKGFGASLHAMLGDPIHA